MIKDNKPTKLHPRPRCSSAAPGRMVLIPSTRFSCHGLQHSRLVQKRFREDVLCGTYPAEICIRNKTDASFWPWGIFENLPVSHTSFLSHNYFTSMVCVCVFLFPFSKINFDPCLLLATYRASYHWEASIPLPVLSIRMKRKHATST